MGEHVIKYVVHGEVVGRPSLLKTGGGGGHDNMKETGDEDEESREKAWILPCFVDGILGRAIGSASRTLVVP